MNVVQNNILIVDDSPSDIQVLIENLKSEFRLSVAKSGHKALEMASAAEPPQAILLDVSMPQMDGYDTCKALKSDPNTADIDIIFVSAHDTTDEKLKGYNAGASDYLIKPVQPDELRKKVRVAVSNYHQRASVKAQQASAMEAAMSAITDAGEQATVVSFLRSSFNVTSLQHLAQLIVQSCQVYGLASTVQIRADEQLIHAASDMPVPPLEQELLYQLRDSGRIHQRGRRLILNFGQISQIIKNMPDNEDKCGRLRDHLAVILEGARSQCDRLILARKLETLLAESKLSLSNIKEIQAQQKQAGLDIIDRLFSEVQGSFLSYGLTEDQENILLSLIKKAVDETLENFDAGLLVDTQMEMIIARIGAFVETTVHDEPPPAIDDSLEFF